MVNEIKFDCCNFSDMGCAYETTKNVFADVAAW